MTIARLKEEIYLTEKYAKPNRTDHFIYLDPGVASFPCCLCSHMSKDLEDAPCKTCCHYA